MRRVALGSTLVALAIAVGALVVNRDGTNDHSELLLTRALSAQSFEMDALPRGTLEVDLERGCVRLSGQPVVWPTGTTLTGDPPVLRFPGGVTAVPGDTVYGGGGHVPRPVVRASEHVEGDVEAALECARRNTTVVYFWASDGTMSVAPGSS